MNNGKVLPGKCGQCTKSQVKKDAEKRVAEAEVMGQEDTIEAQDLVDAHHPAPNPASDWCCIYCVHSLEDDFVNEKPITSKAEVMSVYFFPSFTANSI